MIGAPGRRRAVAAARPSPHDGPALDGADPFAIHRCDDALARHLAEAARRFGSAALGLVDLPPLGAEPIVQAQVEVAAVLYWCREVEGAGLPSFVEALARRLATGELVLDLGGAAQPLALVWRQRQQRFGESERQGLYGRTFGDGPTGVDAQLRALALLVAEVGRRRPDLGIADLNARVGTMGGDLARRLSDRATGIAAFAAREIVAQIREALALLRNPDLCRALGGGAPWTILARWGPSVLGRQTDVSRQLGRATSGMEIVRWLARNGAGTSLSRQHPVVSAAERWLASSGVPVEPPGGAAA
jgi:hypothetical protein